MAMNELFAVFDSAGNHIGVEPRARVHRDGFWHRAANVFVFRSDGRLLIQRRQGSKDVYPGAWDVSVAEHVKVGESFADAAARGLNEELGVAHTGLAPLGGVITSRLEVEASGVKDYEFQQSFRTVFDAAVAPCLDEVAEIRLVTGDKLATEVAQRPDFFTPWFRASATELGILPSGYLELPPKCDLSAGLSQNA